MAKFRAERSEKRDRGERTPRFSMDSADRFSRPRNRRDSGQRSFGRDGPRRDRSRSEGSRPGMHSVVCDKCGSRCEVPFVPTGDKPVYCSDCFRKNDSGAGRSGSRSDSAPSNFSAELQQINKKLDRIIEALELE